MVRGFKLGYGVVTPDEHWVLDQLGPGVRIKTLDGLGKMFVDSALGYSLVFLLIDLYVFYIYIQDFSPMNELMVWENCPFLHPLFSIIATL